MAKRHAIIDLVGGHHSMDWSDVKFYFDPGAQRLEPVSYESFSAFPTKKLAGSGRFTGKRLRPDPSWPNAGAELHDALFNDADFFAAYVHELEHVSRTGYLDSTFAALAGALDTASATLYGEFPYKELDRSIYYKNQDIIRRSLDVPKAVHAYKQETDEDGVLVLKIVPINSLPIEAVGLTLADDRMLLPVSRTIVPSRRSGGLGTAIEVVFPVGGIPDTLLAGPLTLQCAVLGSSTLRAVEVFPTALVEPEHMDQLLVNHAPNALEFDFLVVNDSARTIHFKSGNWKLTGSLVVPAGYRWYASAPLSVELVDGARIISYSPLEWKGSEEAHIRIFSTDSSSHGVHVIEAPGTSKVSFVDIINLSRFEKGQSRSADLSFHKSNINLSNCNLTGTGNTLLDVSVASATLVDCLFTGGSDQLELHQVRAQVRSCRFDAADDDAMSLEGGVVQMTDVKVRSAVGIGLKVTAGASINGKQVVLEDVGQGIEARDGATLKLSGGSIGAVQEAVKAEKASMRDGAVRVELEKVKVTSGEVIYSCGEGSSIVVDGKQMCQPATRKAEPEATNE